MIGTKPKLPIIKGQEIEQNWTKYFVHSCLLPWHSVNHCKDTVRDCELSILSVEDCLMLLSFIQNGWWCGLRLKIGPFEHKIYLGFILFATICAK